MTEMSILCTFAWARARARYTRGRGPGGKKSAAGDVAESIIWKTGTSLSHACQREIRDWVYTFPLAVIITYLNYDGTIMFNSGACC